MMYNALTHYIGYCNDTINIIYINLIINIPNEYRIINLSILFFFK